MRFHLPVRTSEAGHIQAQSKRRQQRLETETDHHLSHLKRKLEDPAAGMSLRSKMPLNGRELRDPSSCVHLLE